MTHQPQSYLNVHHIVKLEYIPFTPNKFYSYHKGSKRWLCPVEQGVYFMSLFSNSREKFIPWSDYEKHKIALLGDQVFTLPHVLIHIRDSSTICKYFKTEEEALDYLNDLVSVSSISVHYIKE